MVVEGLTLSAALGVELSGTGGFTPKGTNELVVGVTRRFSGGISLCLTRIVY